MPHEAEKEAYSIEDYSTFMSALSEGGFEVVVIGGCAVGAYASLRGESIHSADLDVYTTPETLERILDWAPAMGIRVVKRPRPRALRVAVLEWNGKEVNVLTETDAFPPPQTAIRLAREFDLTGRGNPPILIADPFDLLANKLKVNRPKDRMHQEVLRRFVEEEVVQAFREEKEPRARIAPARRFLETIGKNRLPENLAARLLLLARTAADFRFLLHHAPNREMEEEMLRKAPDETGLRAELEAIRKRRR